ncbi:PP2C family protein-serine/threonine phosphatase [Cryptosporangium aurantiacum]|uniref:Serine phosphatase RsbU, regulator of sigma subunit n=1 Tax=Cryptosporangium aurantiacum TaxID=134849 RepID=A0A1M7PR35_9ACTN|nr:PP2C family protein-serine/threonine phosphatase [Cryptosporangium aurantiacum]SHN19871.1 Serine phosphatase RsbU, regulator of sigma subunit [Cryptosporangium aurantiacum]
MAGERPGPGEDMFDALLHASHQCHPEDLPTLVGAHAGPVGLRDPVIYLVDLEQDQLVWLAPRKPSGPPPEVRLSVDTSVAGSAFTDLEVRITPAPGGHWLWVTLLDGTERLGVLRLSIEEPDETTVRRARRLASLVALMLISKRAHSDAYRRLARVRDMSASAEIQWSLLPPGTFATEAVVVAGMVEPAYEVGGDLFDYSMNGAVLHAAVFDAAGHDLSSAVLASLTVGGYRNARRRNLGLAETAAEIDATIHAQFGTGKLVTGVLAQLETQTGELQWTLAGHPPPILVRDHSLHQVLECPTGLPLGIGLERDRPVCHAQLQPGDRILLYTDGLTEARDADGAFFGLDRLVDFLVTHDKRGHTAPETLRQLVRALLDHHGDRLRDDAGLLLVEWRHDPRLSQP